MKIDEELEEEEYEKYLKRIKSINNPRDILKEIIEMYENGWICTDGYYQDITFPVLERAEEIIRKIGVD